MPVDSSDRCFQTRKSERCGTIVGLHKVLENAYRTPHWRIYLHFLLGINAPFPPQWHKSKLPICRVWRLYTQNWWTPLTQKFYMKSPCMQGTCRLKTEICFTLFLLFNIAKKSVTNISEIRHISYKSVGGERHTCTSFYKSQRTREEPDRVGNVYVGVQCNQTTKLAIQLTLCTRKETNQNVLPTLITTPYRSVFRNRIEALRLSLVNGN